MEMKDWILFFASVGAMAASFYMAMTIHMAWGIPGVILGIIMNAGGGADFPDHLDQDV